MNYALIENEIVTNIIWLYPGNASDFPNAVPMNDISVGIGDTYKEGIFYRNGERVLTAAEIAQAEFTKANNTIAELDAALLESTYQNIIGGV